MSISEESKDTTFPPLHRYKKLVEGGVAAVQDTTSTRPQSSRVFAWSITKRFCQFICYTAKHWWAAGGSSSTFSFFLFPWCGLSLCRCGATQAFLCWQKRLPFFRGVDHVYLGLVGAGTLFPLKTSAKSYSCRPRVPILADGGDLPESGIYLFDATVGTRILKFAPDFDQNYSNTTSR